MSIGCAGSAKLGAHRITEEPDRSGETTITPASPALLLLETERDREGEQPGIG